MSSRNKSILTYFVVILLFLAITICYTSPLVSRVDDHVMESSSGDTLFNIYVISWTAHSLGTNPFNLFNATIFYPNPNTLAYSDHALMSSLIALPVLGLTGNPTLAFNFVVIMSFLISSFGAFLLVDYLARDKLAAFSGGIIYGFALFKLAHLPHMQVLSTGYIPLAILCLHAYTEKKKYGYALGFVGFTVAMFWTAWGYGFFLAFAVLVYLLVLLAVERRRVVGLLTGKLEKSRRRRLYRWAAGLVSAFVLVALIMLPFVAPYLAVQSENPGFQREIEEVENYGADVTDFLVAPGISGAWGRITGIFRPDPYRRGNSSERSLFVGLLPVVLSILGVAYLYRHPLRRNRFTMWFYIVLLALSAVMCLGVALFVFERYFGVPMPYRLLYHLFPGFKAVRTPARMIVLVTLSLAVLGGFGVKWLREKLEGRYDKITVVSLLVFVILLLLGEMMPSSITMARVPPKSEIPEVYSWLGRQEGEAPAVILPAADGSSERELQYSELAPLRMYFNTVNWKKMVNGYSGYMPASYEELAQATREFPSREGFQFLRKLGVEYIVVEGGLYGEETVRRIVEWAEADPGVELVHQSQGDYVLRLR